MTIPCTWRDGTAVARWQCRNGNVIILCQQCLDAWFDNADDDDFLEPAAWSWLAHSEGGASALATERTAA